MTLREMIAEAGGLPRLIVNGLLVAVCILAFFYFAALGGVALGLGPEPLPRITTEGKST